MLTRATPRNDAKGQQAHVSKFMNTVRPQASSCGKVVAAVDRRGGTAGMPYPEVKRWTPIPSMRAYTGDDLSTFNDNR